MQPHPGMWEATWRDPLYEPLNSKKQVDFHRYPIKFQTNQSSLKRLIRLNQLTTLSPWRPYGGKQPPEYLPGHSNGLMFPEGRQARSWTQSQHRQSSERWHMVLQELLLLRPVSAIKVFECPQNHDYISEVKWHKEVGDRNWFIWISCSIALTLEFPNSCFWKTQPL